MLDSGAGEGTRIAWINTGSGLLELKVMHDSRKIETFLQQLIVL
jgi:hypothetical protein